MGIRPPKIPPPPPPPNPFLPEYKGYTGCSYVSACIPNEKKGARLVDRKETLIEKREREAQKMLRVHNIDTSKMSKREAERLVKKISNMYDAEIKKHVGGTNSVGPG